MKIPLTKSFVKTFIEDLNLRNNDIVLENVEKINDIEIFRVYIESIIYLSEDNNIIIKAVNNFLNTKLIEPLLSFGLQSVNEFVKVIKFTLKHSMSSGINLIKIGFSIIRKIKTENFTLVENISDEEFEQIARGLSDTKIRNLIEKMQRKLVSDIINVLEKYVNFGNYMEMDSIQSRLYDIFNSNFDNKTKNYNIKNIIKQINDITKSFPLQAREGLTKITELNIVTINKIINFYKHLVTMLNNEKLDDKKLYNYTMLKYKQFMNKYTIQAEKIKKEILFKLLPKVVQNAKIIAKKVNKKNYLIQSEVKKALSSENYIKALKTWIKGTFSIIKNEIIRIFKSVNFRGVSNFLNSIRSLLQESENVALTATTLIMYFASISYIVYIAIKVIKIIINKVKEIFLSKDKESTIKTMKNKIDVYKNQLNHIKKSKK